MPKLHDVQLTKNVLENRIFSSVVSSKAFHVHAAAAENTWSPCVTYSVDGMIGVEIIQVIHVIHYMNSPS